MVVVMFMWLLWWLCSCSGGYKVVVPTTTKTIFSSGV